MRATGTIESTTRMGGIICAERIPFEPFENLRGAPGGIIESGHIPSRQFAPGVVNLPIPNAVADDRSLGHFPGAVAGHADRLSVSEFDVDLQQQGGLFIGSGDFPRAERRPSPTQHRSESVLTRLQLRGDVIGGIEDPHGIGRPRRVENIAPDLLAVDSAVRSSQAP